MALIQSGTCTGVALLVIVWNVNKIDRIVRATRIVCDTRARSSIRDWTLARNGPVIMRPLMPSITSPTRGSRRVSAPTSHIQDSYAYRCIAVKARDSSELGFACDITEVCGWCKQRALHTFILFTYQNLTFRLMMKRMTIFVFASKRD